IWFGRSVLNFNHPDIMTTSNDNTNNTIVKRENPYKKLGRVLIKSRLVTVRPDQCPLWPTIVMRGPRRVASPPNNHLPGTAGLIRAFSPERCVLNCLGGGL